MFGLNSALQRPGCLRCFLHALAILALTAGDGAAQQYPVKPIRMIVPAAAGGGLDIAARNVAQSLGQRLGQQVIIDNIPGAGFVIGTQTAVRATPDGYTLLYTSAAPITMADNFEPKPAYDPRRDLVGVAALIRNPGLIVVHPSVKAGTLAEFVALAKSQPDKLFYGSPGAGHSFHLATEMLAKQAGIKMTHIPFKGSAQAVVSLLAGDIHFLIQSPESVGKHIKSGKLRALATLETHRLRDQPDVPTLDQAGLTHLGVAFWHGIFVPSKTPPGVIAALERGLIAIAKSPEFSKRMDDMGFEPLDEGTRAFGARLASEFELWPQVVKSLGIDRVKQ